MRLLRFIFQRLVLAVVTLLALFTLTFFLMRAVPGDPLMRTKEIPEETRKNLEARYGLDKPLYMQYVIQLKQVFIHGDFGTSFRTIGREVNDIIREQFPVSASIGIVSVLIGVTIGIGLGIVAALYRNGLIDRMAMFLCVAGISLPSFLFAYLFQYGLAVYPLTVLKISPESWLRPAGWGEPRDFVMPSISMALGIIASITRMLKSQMIEVGFSEYVKTAKAKGVSVARLIVMHQIRNAILPIISIIFPILVFTMSGSLIMENVFGIPGLGRSYMSSIQNSDYNVIMGLTVFFGGFLIIMNLITDILYGLIDPRIRVG
ncbi:MAG: ABC transporter permease [Silvanigrellaceae bacterium]